MEGSLKLLTVAGIDVRMHLTFPLIVVWGAVQFGYLLGQGWTGAAFGVIVTVLLFIIVLMHELGHSLTARRYGIGTRQIVLLPIGGVAELERLPENPRHELVIALAGPAVNFVLALGLWLVAQVTPVGGVWMTGEVLERGALAGGAEAIFRYVFTANLFIGVFNLVPAFPLDGGRVLRALLALRLGMAQATSVAVGIGQRMAWLFGLWGLLQVNVFLIVLAVFVYLAASGEGQVIQVRTMLSGVRVRQVFARRVLVLAPTDRVSRAVEATLASFQSDFPVCDGQHLVGLLTAGDVLKALQRHEEGVAIGRIMRTDFPVAGLNESVFDVQQRMSTAGVDAVPVVEAGQFLGMVTSRDILELYRMLSVNPRLLGRPPH